MTQPEETTAAKKATVNINIMDAPQVERALSDAAAMVAWARAERDEQRARAEKAEAELAHVRLMLQERTVMGDEYYAGKQRAENLLAERTRERDEAKKNFGISSRQFDELGTMLGQQASESPIMAAARVKKERNEAREQLAKLERAGERLRRELEQTQKQNEDYLGRIVELETEETRRSDVLRARSKECDEARSQLAKVEWAKMVRTGKIPQFACLFCEGICPELSRTVAGSGYSVDEFGHRPTCWFAKKEAERKDLDPAAVAKVAHIDRCNELFKSGRLFIGCDFGFPEVAAFNVYRYACGADVGKKDATKSEPARCSLCLHPDVTGKPHPHARCKDHDGSTKEPARPEPRFKVGEKVFWRGKEVVITWAEWFPPVRVWCYGSTYSATPMPESELKPAPKFAVGDWIESKSVTGPVIARHWERSRATTWSYDVQATDMVRMLYEFELTAQTPQHKHDCKGSVFLGRYEGFDLWWRPTMREVVAVEPSVARCYAVNGDLYNPAAVEAWRRAVARGLV